MFTNTHPGVSMPRMHQKPCLDMSRPVRIATWNTLTMNKVGYPEATAHVFSRMEIKLAGLTETRLTGNGELLLQDFSLIYSGGDKHVRGVALLVHNSIRQSLQTWNAISDRILTARFHHKHGHLTVVVVYAPVEASTNEDKDNFYSQLSSLTQAIPSHDRIVVLGDFNAVSGVDRTGYESVVGPFGHGTINDNSVRLLSYCSAFGLSMLGSWY